jgi:hypothetical protein
MLINFGHNKKIIKINLDGLDSELATVEERLAFYVPFWNATASIAVTAWLYLVIFRPGGWAVPAIAISNSLVASVSAARIDRLNLRRDIIKACISYQDGEMSFEELGEYIYGRRQRL